MDEPDIKTIRGMQFSIMGPEEIRNRSVVEVTKHDTYEKDIPVTKGIFDPRMGVTDMGKICKTCGQKNISCPGHFGHVELARPVYHIHFQQILIKILKCVCFKCSKLLVNKENIIIQNIIKKPNKERFQDIFTECQKIKLCGQEIEDGCGCVQPDNYKTDGLSGIHAKWKNLDIDESNISNEEANKLKNQIIPIEYIYQILSKISDEDVRCLGFSNYWCRPEWLICSVLPVPPPCVRPSVKQDNSQRMDDDLTHKLSDIIKANNTLSDKIYKNARPEVIDSWTKLLQYHIATLIDNDIPGIAQSAHRSGRVLKSVRQRLKGKDGRIRNNLMGKRVDYSARSVITPDPNIELDQLGVPYSIAKTLTFPETVNRFNIKKLQKLIKNGNVYPGVNSIIVKKEGNIKKSIFESNKDTIILEYGDIVNRHLQDDDYVLFNRQPSLHKMSMMGHRVKVMSGNTFRLNISVTPPYNADFDGDEMNCHAPQSYESYIELKEIMSVTKQIISPRENKPIITIVQDTLLGVNRLTLYDNIKYIPSSNDRFITTNKGNNLFIKGSKTKTKFKTQLEHLSYFTKKQFMNIICNVSTFGREIPKPEVNVNNINYWSGKQVISYILPKNINLKMNNGLGESEKDKANYVIILDGILKQGSLDKGLFTKVSKGLIHTIYNDFGPERAKDFIDDLQKIISYYLLIEGFSVGISDMIADKLTNNKINKIINKKKKEIDEIMQDIHLNIFENYTGQTNHEYFESKVNSILNKTLAETGKLGLASLDSNNRAINMINSGSKGKPTNIAQMVACLGQQNVDGKRIPYCFTNRTLPHYYKFDDSSEARGFVENSFISGQTPQEYFFHAMGGREGLIDTAVKTSATGYVQRKLIKAMEDLKVNNDYSVRTSSNIIVQFIYGGDGMDATFVESQPLLIIKLNTEKLIEKYLFDDKTEWAKILDEDIVENMKKNKDYLDIFKNIFTNILNTKKELINKVFKNSDIQNNIYYPVHLQRIIENLCGMPYSNNNLSNISPLDILKENNELKEKLYITDDFKNNKIMHILIDIHLSPKILINEYRITREQYDTIKDVIIKTFKKSKISPGEMVGAVAAQSIGEPATQMTLNTFHYAGVSAKSNVTRGIPRLTELLHISKTIKSPSVKIYINDKYNEDKNKCNYIKNKLEYTKLNDIVISSEIHYDPKHINYETDIEEDKGFLEIYKLFEETENEQYDSVNISPWIIRFKFNKDMILEKGIIMEDIQFAINNYDSDSIKFIYSDENSKELIGRITIESNILSNSEIVNGLEDQSDIIDVFKDVKQQLLENVIIKGINNITNIVMSEENYMKKIDGELVDKKQIVLETDGTNLIDVLSNEYINNIKTISNDILEIFEIFGIEAARNALIKEIKDVVEYEGSYINNRHIELLCEMMTSSGRLISINRQGINRGDIGPLAKCSFEDTTDQLIKAGIFGEVDRLEGVSSNIMLGQKIKAGTNNSEILLDEQKLLNELINTSTEDIYDEEITDKNIDNLFVDDEEIIEGCEDDNFEFSF